LDEQENSERIHSFLATCIAIIVLKEKPEYTIKAMELFLNYM